MKEKIYLILEFVKKDLKERYVGTSFGQLWLIISPLITIFIYTIIFSDFMKMKLHMVNSKYAYSIYLIPGILSWNFFSSLVMRLTMSIYEKSHIIKKIDISMYIFYLSISLTEFVIYFISMILGILFLIIIGHHLSLNFLFIFVFMFIMWFFTLSLGIIFSLLAPFFKDIKEFVPIILQLWFWMTPIVYVKSLLMHKYSILIKINPIYYIIQPMQNLFLYSKFNWNNLFYSIIISTCVFIIAIYLYKKLIREIKDII